MTREGVLTVLRSHEPELLARGVAHVALFGSLARGDESERSAVDVFLRFAPDASVTLWDYAALKRRVARMLRLRANRIDVVDIDGVSARVRSAVERDALYAF